VYSRENPNDVHMAKVLTEHDARRIASDIAKQLNAWKLVIGFGRA
jgi:hypothetical protein